MDIVERLRSLKSDEYIENLVGKAADEIERLRRKIHDLQEALKYIADMPDGWEEDEELNLMFVVDNHVKAAREALEETA